MRISMRHIGSVLFFLWVVYITYITSSLYTNATAKMVTRFGAFSTEHCVPANLDNYYVYERQVKLYNASTGQPERWNRINVSDNFNYNVFTSGQRGTDNPHPWGYSTCDAGDLMIGARLNAGNFNGSGTVGVDVLCCKL